MSVKELLQEAQFHGSNRLCERKFRYCWGIGLLALFWAAGSIVAVTISRFIENPAFISIQESEAIPLEFPSVIMCPELEFPDSKMDKFVTELDYPPNINATFVRSVLQQLGAFYSPDVTYSLHYLKMLELVLDYNLLDVETVGRRLTVNCEEAFLKCRWQGAAINCSNLFVMELTAYGFCCVFNGRSLRREIFEYGIHNMEPPSIIYTKDTSPMSALTFVVNSSQKESNVDLTYKWLGVVSGRKYVESGVNGTPIAANTEHWMAFGSRSFHIDDVARGLSPALRRCRMFKEKLTYFPVYTKRYCLLECEMKRTMRRCQCVRIAHPRPPSVPYCRAANLLCSKNAAVPYATNQCDCPTTCDSGIDDFVMQSFPLVAGKYVNDPFYDNLDFSKVSVVRVYIRHLENKHFTRRSFFSSYDLFSQIGGVFNVFFGCSMLTILELIQLAWHMVKGRRQRVMNKILPVKNIMNLKKRKENKVKEKKMKVSFQKHLFVK